MHAHTAGHAIVESLEAGESWRCCYLDDEYVRDPVASATAGPSPA
jgi:hypothetical protein